MVQQTGTGGTTATLRIGPIDYRGNMAAGMVYGCTDQTNPNCYVYDNGMMYQNSQVGFAEVTDGTSNTMLIGETLIGIWPDATSCCVRTTLNRRFNRPNVISGRTLPYWQSQHGSVVNFAKVDGSVVSLKDGINKVVLLRLMTRNGGETISSDAY